MVVLEPGIEGIVSFLKCVGREVKLVGGEREEEKGEEGVEGKRG